MRRATELAGPLIKRWEGLHKKIGAKVAPYLCPANVWTIGWGSTKYPDGRAVTKDDPPLSPETCDRIFDADLPRYMAQALKASPVLAAHEEKLAAVTSFVYNLGAGRYRASTLRRRVDAQDWGGAAQEFSKWTRGGGRVLPGLVARRAQERALFERGR